MFLDGWIRRAEASGINMLLPMKERTGIAAPLVKSSINPRIRRNLNGLFTLYNSRTGIEFIDRGFVRIIFAVSPAG